MPLPLRMVFCFALIVFFANAAHADLKFIDANHSNLSAVNVQGLDAEFAPLNVFKTHVVNYDRGGMTKAVLIDAWSIENHRDNIDTEYYRKNKPVYYKIDKQFKEVYFSISPSAIQNLKKYLADDGVAYNPQLRLEPSNYVLKNGTLPAVYSLNGKKVVLVLTTMGMCVLRNHIISTASPAKLFSKLPCPGGHTMWLSQLNGIEYNPLCKGAMCKSPSELGEAVKSYLIKSSLVTLPDASGLPAILKAATPASR